MRFTAVAALLGLLAVQQAAAGGDDSDWQCSPGFPICSKSSNQCTNPQKGGISCAEESQPTTGSCSSVQGMGVKNANYGTMKRIDKRSLFPRNGGSSASHTDQKCIKQTCGSTKGSGITISKGSGSQYSCNAHHIVVEQPTVVQITHYNDNNDQTCSYHQLCNANEVTTINNDNCGQSDHHEVCVHPTSPSGPNVPIGVVGMNFDCVPAPPNKCSPPASSAPASSAPPKSSTPVVVPSVTPSAPSPSESGTTSPVVLSSSTPSTPSPSVTPSSPSVVQSGTTTPVVSPSVTPSSPSVVQSGTTTPVVSPSSTPSPSVTPSSPSPSESGTTTPVVSPSVTPSSPSVVQSGTTTPVVSPSSTPSPSVTPSSPSPSESGTTTVPVETETTSLTTYTTLTSCPVTSTTVVNGSTSVIVKTSLITSTVTTCTRCVEKPSSTPVVPPPVNTQPAPSPSSPAVPPPPAPTTTTPGSPQQVGTTSSVPSPPAVYTSTPVVLTTTTEIVLTTVTTCPVTTTISQGPHQPPTVITTSTVSTVLTTSTSTITTTTLSPPPSSPVPVVPGQSPSSTPVSPPVQPSSTPVSPPAQPSPPPAFKGCISAYYDLKGCRSNTDYDCYCKQDEVTTKVFECITNYEQDVAKQAAAMASYQGLCAQYVPQHPVIVTKSVQLIPTPVSIPSGSSPAVVAPPAGPVTPAPAVPVQAGQTTTTTAPIPGSPAPTPAPSGSVPLTTIPFSATVTIACPIASGLVNQITDGQVQVQATGAMAPGCTTTSLLSTQLVVSPMHFATSGTSVGLAAGTPAANQAGVTASPPAASPVPGVAGVAGASGSASVPASSTPASTTPVTFKGAAAKASHSGVFLSVVLAAVGLVVYA